MKKMLESLREASRRAIEEAVDMDALEALRVRYLGKKGELTAILKQMGKLSAEERPVIGQLANEVRGELESGIESRKSALAAKLQEAKLRAETLDVTMPGKEISLGKKHVINTVLDEVVDIFIGMGFSIVDGPEIELSKAPLSRAVTGAARRGLAGAHGRTIRSRFRRALSAGDAPLCCGGIPPYSRSPRNNILFIP